MARLIDADTLKAVFEEKNSVAVCGAKLCKAIISRIDESPTVDAVPVIRCKDCKYLRLTGTIWRCQNRSVMMLCEMDDFCSRAERKEE